VKVFVCDNYDSFTFNLVQALGALGAEPQVARNDEITLEEIEALRPDAVVISPGPGRPAESGISISLVRWCADSRTPLLGVCLGHQAISEAYGARITNAPTLMHGKTSMIHHDSSGVLAGIPDPFEAMRYHSLATERETLPPELRVTAWTDDGVVMGLRHTELPIEGVQFHPESILTPHGPSLLGNFVARRS
jgi:anthranilate synthase/aminodeoxychorismate synthase-like glutamine amidotransferase